MHVSTQCAVIEGRPGPVSPAPRGPAGDDVLGAVCREFRRHLPRVLAGHDPAARYLVYRHLMRMRFGVRLPSAEALAARGPV